MAIALEFRFIGHMFYHTAMSYIMSSCALHLHPPQVRCIPIAIAEHREACKESKGLYGRCLVNAQGKDRL